MTIIQKKLTNKIIIEYKIDFLNYSYTILLKICKLD